MGGAGGFAATLKEPTEVCDLCVTKTSTSVSNNLAPRIAGKKPVGRKTCKRLVRKPVGRNFRSVTAF